MQDKLEKEQARNWAQLESSLLFFRVDPRVKSSKVGLILLAPHASWSLVRACLGCVCFGRRNLPTEAVRMRAIHRG